MKLSYANYPDLKLTQLIGISSIHNLILPIQQITIMQKRLNFRNPKN